MTEIKTDKNTLPMDSQKVRWQTQKDIDKGEWKEGVFIAEEGMFYVNEHIWDYDIHVVHWESL